MICVKCLQDKDLTAFHVDRRKRDHGQYRLRQQCRKCVNQRSWAAIKAKKDSDPEFLAAFRRRAAKRHRKMRDTNRPMYVWKSLRAVDKRRGHLNDLTKEQIAVLLAEPCLYCADAEAMITIDRIDNALGHAQGNVVSACLRCNLLRSDMPYEAWKIIAPAVRQAREVGALGSWRTQPFIKRKVD